MITHISIRDFATIENLDIGLSPGLSVITGETGAGKSIIIEAVSLALGSRADSTMVRNGCKKALIQIVAELGTPRQSSHELQVDRQAPADGLFSDELQTHSQSLTELQTDGQSSAGLQTQEQYLTGMRTDGQIFGSVESAGSLSEDSDNEIILTREISASGKSVAKINGEIVSLAKLAAFSASLADIHGQYDHQSLFKTENHLELIDSFHAFSITPVKAEVQKTWHEYSKVKKELESLLQKESDTRRRLDFMRYELDEIQRIDPQPEEDILLRERLAILQNSGHIFEKLNTARTALFESSPSAVDSLGAAMRSLQEISRFSKDLAEIEGIVSDSYYAIEDLTGTMRSVMEHVEFSPKALDETITRLDKVENLTKKYGGSINSVLRHRDELAAELDDIENIDSIKGELAAASAEHEKALIAVSCKLTELRKISAHELEERINEELIGLNFKNATFAISFHKSESLLGRLSENGADTVEFLISTNKGQDLLPLVKIASGGEMSRMMLAFKAVTGDYDDIPTMIFDEIDNGISGVTASIVGKKLHLMAKSRQIICITHLPQIAACGEHHLMIQKSSDDVATYTTVAELSSEDRAVEIARLLGGANITETTLLSARELIALSR
jgi:DNA repair protein RecN (Recombination protein N)